MFHVACLASLLWEQKGGARHFILCETGDLFNAICVICHLILKFFLCLLSKQCSRPVKDMINLFREYLLVLKKIRLLNTPNTEIFFKTETVDKLKIL